MYLRDLAFLIDPFQKVEVNVFGWRNDEEYYIKTVYEDWYKCNLMNCSVICIYSGFAFDSKQSFLRIDVFDHDSPIG